MKAPVSRNPAVVRARILDAAQAEFMEHGYAGASTNRILDRFGGSKPTMFRHFPTKRAMFEAVVARIAGDWSTAVDLRTLPDDPRGWLTGYGLATARWILSEANIFVGRMAVAEGHAFPEVAATYRALAVDPIEQTLAARLAAWTGQGLLACADPAGDATAFLDLALSGMVSRRLYRVESGDAELAPRVRRAVDLFLHGCTCKPDHVGQQGASG